MFHVTYWHCHGWPKWVTELHLKGWSWPLQDWSMVIPWLFTSFRFSSIWSLRCSTPITSWCLFSFFSSQSRNVWTIPMRYALWSNQLMLLLTFLRFELESCISLNSVLDESDFSRIKQYFQNDQKHKSVWFKNLVYFGMS